MIHSLFRLVQKGLLLLLILICISAGLAAGESAVHNLSDDEKEEKPLHYRVGKDILITAGELEEEQPSISWDGKNYFMVWEDKREGAFDIYGSRINASGEVLDPNGIPISIASSDQIRPRVIWNGSNYFVVWQDKRGEKNWEVYGARVTQEGKVLDQDGIPVSTGEEDRTTVSISWDGKNHFIAWERMHPAPFKADIYGARVTPEGKVLDLAGIPIAHLPDEQYYSGISWDGKHYLVVWSDKRDSSSFDIYGTRIGPDGKVLDREGFVVSKARGDQFYPAIAWNGKVHLVAWMDKRDKEEASIYGARVSPDGSVMDPEGIAISDTKEFHALPFVIARGEEFLVTWDEYEKISHNDIYATRVDSGGKVLDPEAVPIFTEFENQSQSNVATDGKQYFIVWRDWRVGIPFQGDLYGVFLDFPNAASPAATSSSEAEQRSGPYIIHQISVDYKNPDTLYAATSHYGLLRSKDRGRNWTRIANGLKSYTHRRIVVNPSKTEILYAGAWGGGMSKSIDGGNSWQEINAGLGNTAITDLVLHPADPERIYVATETGVFRSENGGKHWEPFNHGLSPVYDESFQTLLIVPEEPYTMYLGSAKGLYRWTKKLGKWVSLKKGHEDDITALAYSPSDKVVYAGTLSSGLFRSRDEGENWNHVEGTGKAWVKDILIPPTNNDIIYLVMKGEGVLKTMDRGKRWEMLGGGLPNTYIQSITMNPSDTKTLYAGTFEGEDGIYISHDEGNSWIRAQSIPMLTLTEVLTSLPMDEDMRNPKEIETLSYAPETATHIFISEDPGLVIPPAFVKCNACHGWTEPSLNLRRTQWRVPANIRNWKFTVTERMSKRSHLTLEEEKEIIQFLEEYSQHNSQAHSFPFSP